MEKHKRKNGGTKEHERRMNGKTVMKFVECGFNVSLCYLFTNTRFQYDTCLFRKKLGRVDEPLAKD